MAPDIQGECRSTLKSEEEVRPEEEEGLKCFSADAIFPGLLFSIERSIVRLAEKMVSSGEILLSE